MSCIFSCFSCFWRSSQTTPLQQPINQTNVSTNTSGAAMRALSSSDISKSASSLNDKKIEKQTNSGSSWFRYLFGCFFGSSSRTNTKVTPESSDDSIISKSASTESLNQGTLSTKHSEKEISISTLYTDRLIKGMKQIESLKKALNELTKNKTNSFYLSAVRLAFYGNPTIGQKYGVDHLIKSITPLVNNFSPQAVTNLMNYSAVFEELLDKETSTKAMEKLDDVRNRQTINFLNILDRIAGTIKSIANDITLHQPSENVIISYAEEDLKALEVLPPLSNPQQHALLINCNDLPDINWTSPSTTLP